MRLVPGCKESFYEHQKDPRVRPYVGGCNLWRHNSVAGVSGDLEERLQNWWIAYTDRAARLQYH